MTESPWHTVYFLGAGATRADFPDAPLGDDLLHAILCSERPDSGLFGFLSSVFDNDLISRKGSRSLRPRLDDVFTLLDANIAGRAPSPAGYPYQAILDVRRSLIARIAAVLDTALGNEEGKSARRFSRAIEGRNAVIVSTNYDIVMDNVLVNGDSIDYGVTVRSALFPGDIPPGQTRMTYVARRLTLKPRPTPISSSTPLLKLHGSLNWLYCARCDELDVTLRRKGASIILTDPSLGRCTMTSCTCDYDTILVGPSLEQRYENRILRETWSLAEQVLANAQRLVVIGYSLPEADYLIRAMLARRFAKRSEGVLVVSLEENSQAREQLANRYRRLFPRCKISWGGFEAFASELEKL